MATSGTTAYGVTELDILTSAAVKLGVAENGQAPDVDATTILRRNLNMLMKQWVAQADYAPGLKMWTRRLGYLFMQKSQVVYSLGPTGDEAAADSYVATTLANSAAGGVGTVTVADATGIVSAMRIGILLDSGTMQWTTVSGTPSGAVVTLGAALSSAASSGNAVYVYTSKVQRPFEIVTAVLRDASGSDTPMDPNLSVEEYEAIPSKTSEGTPSRLYFEAQRTNAKVSIDCAPSALTNVIRFKYLAYPEDTTASTQDMDFPAEWFKPLVGQLVIDSAPDFSRAVTVDMKLYRDEGLALARNAYPAKSIAYYQSDPDSY
jgi:hypothetical protein